MCGHFRRPTVSWRWKGTRNVRGQSRPPGSALLIRSRPRYGTEGTRVAIEHWFDSLNRTLLTDEAPRRGLLRSASALMAGLALGAGRAAVAKKKKKRGDKKKKDNKKGNGNGNGGGGSGSRCGQPACANQWPDDPKNRTACEEKCGRCRIKAKFCIIPPDDNNPNLRATCCEEHQSCCPDHGSETGYLCVNLNSDSRHCGECNRECDDGQICLGECIDNPAPPPGACTNCPAPNWRCCEGVNCVEVASDKNNCGSCGNACKLGEQCVNGACTRRSCSGVRPQYCLVETISGPQDYCIAAEDACCDGYYCSWPYGCCPGKKCSTLDGSCPD
jgi:hypothetical protein